MKRMIGIIGIIALTLMLGVSIGWCKEEDVSLVSDLPCAISFGEG